MAAQEDCRDYLRTGRCKYGASCKYRHPPNVQSGGGIRDPTNPSEPQFPIRRGEPTCQYYLKHGTCKFGQACKFHHPPQSEMAAAVMGGGAVVMNVGRTSNRGSGQQIVLNSVDGSTGTSAMALQFLPQRPDEPDCIYFLRNGRCKYGATCRYHHPVAFPSSSDSAAASGSQARRKSQRPPDPSNGMGSRVRSSSSLQMAAESIQGSRSLQGYDQHERQREAPSTPTHFVVTETPLAVVAGNATGSSNSYGLQGEEYTVPLSTSAGAGYSLPRDYNSSSSSISSSYETAPSGVEFQGDSNGVIWSRPVKRIASGGSLSAYDSTPPLRAQPTSFGGTRIGLAPTVSDNSIASRRLRTESMGSTSDHSGSYPDAWNQNSQPTSTTTGWVEQTSSFDHQTRRSHNPQIQRGGERGLPQQESSGRMQSSTQARDPRRRPSNGESHDDGGLSMMTSALLNMLDTPEEAARKSYPANNTPSRMNPISPPSTPRGARTGNTQDRESMPLDERYLGSPAISHQQQYSHVVQGGAELQNSRYDFTSTNEYAHGFATEHSDSRVAKSSYHSSPRSPIQSSPRQHPSKPHPSSNQHPASNVGLYLP